MTVSARVVHGNLAAAVGAAVETSAKGVRAASSEIRENTELGLGHFPATRADQIRSVSTDDFGHRNGWHIHDPPRSGLHCEKIQGAGSTLNQYLADMGIDLRRRNS